MKETILFRLEELKELLEQAFDCAVKYNCIKKTLDGEIVNVDVIELYHNDINTISLAFPFAEHKDEHLAVVEFSDLHMTLIDLINKPITELYDITEIDLGQGTQQYVHFYLS